MHKSIRIFTTLVLMGIASTAFAHGGGLDANGGHTNRKTGEYHCHREPCFSNQRKDEDESKPKDGSKDKDSKKPKAE